MQPTSSGYSGTPLWKKLGMKEHQRVQLINPVDDLNTMLNGALDVVELVQSDANLVLFFTNEYDGLEAALKSLQNSIQRDGSIWVCWYKKASKKPSNLSGDLIRNIALRMDLVDAKVCAVNQDWSGLKLVIRKECR